MIISAEIFNYLVYAWILIALFTFPLLLKVTAPYGRHTSKNWGPMIHSSWGWFIMEIPVIIVFSWFFFTGTAEKSVAVYIMYATFMLHYIHRVFIFPLRRRSNGKQMPLSIVGLAVLFNVCNGFFSGYWFGTLSPVYELSWLSDPRFVIGLLVFFTGMLINLRADNSLLKLRRGGKKGYYIPYGGLFKYISSPNLFGEIIEWLGWALMCWCLPSLAFAIWTMANLIPRALDHHRWYHKKFPDYPAERKAVFPHLL